MPQIFHRSTNTLSRLSIFGALFALAALLWGIAAVNRSAYMTGQGVARVQPVQFSHKHHAGQLGIDCRYCHTQVETAAYAGIPPTQTCMNCHAQIWADSAFLAPVRASFRTDRSLVWQKVHVLPDYVYFNHGIHVQKGVGCVTCHGRVDRMNQVYRAASLQMEWCLACHRRPERYLRPRERVFDLAWRPRGDQAALGRRLVKAYGVRTRTDCSACHR
ncbi:MAG TPA: cytochrome c3 family protein [Candidatus Binatia bacterium]|nr:cytochrome c3 family protein [Candidatus Binatia bacterium]